MDEEGSEKEYIKRRWNGPRGGEVVLSKHGLKEVKRSSSRREGLEFPGK